MKKRKRRNKAAGHKHRVVARSRNRKTRRRSISKSQVQAFMRKHKMNRRRRSSSNPFAKSISLSRPSDLVTAGAGVIGGVVLNKLVISWLPANLTSNPAMAALVSFGIAIGEWWAFSFITPELGAAVGLGGVAEAGSIALSQFLPSIGVSPLSGLGRVGDFVPGRFTVPQNPVLDAATGFPKSQVMTTGAYPRPYAVA